MARMAPLATRAVLALLALTLTACEGEPQQEAAAAPEPAVSPAALPAETRAPATAAAIPARYIGVWDAETGTCDAASDLRLDVGASEIGFYESQGTLTRIAESPDGAAMVDLAMEGEGDKWDMTMTISLSGADKAERLVVQHRGEPGEPAPEPLRLKRCPA
jgi:hypothetical protein